MTALSPIPHPSAEPTDTASFILISPNARSSVRPIYTPSRPFLTPLLSPNCFPNHHIFAVVIRLQFFFLFVGFFYPYLYHFPYSFHHVLLPTECHSRHDQRNRLMIIPGVAFHPSELHFFFLPSSV